VSKALSRASEAAPSVRESDLAPVFASRDAHTRFQKAAENSKKAEFKVEHDNGPAGFLASRANIVLLGFLAIGGYFLVTEHWAHIVPFLPFLLLAACPLMHLFMHGGHGAHGRGDDPGNGPMPTRQDKRR
jgi:hypothetical protein